MVSKLTRFSSNSPRQAAEETIAEAKDLFELARQLDKVSSEIQDEKTRHALKHIVRGVLTSSRKLSSLSSNLVD